MNATRNEVWKPVVGREGLYEVSDRGQVRSLDRYLRAACGGSRLHRGRTLKSRAVNRSSKYLRVSLGGADKPVYRSVHVLVLEAFVGPRPTPNHDACHGDGDPLNNRLENLRWATKSENQRDRVRHGTHHEALKTACLRGHQFTEWNLVKSRLPHRACLSCNRAQRELSRMGKSPSAHEAELKQMSDRRYAELMEVES